MSNFDLGGCIEQDKFFTPLSAHAFFSELSMAEQREMFLLKYNDVSRDDVSSMLNDFIRRDIGKKGYLDEYEAMILMEDRGIVITAMELHAMMHEVDLTKAQKLSFLSWCCAYFHKSFEGLSRHSDDEARLKALDAAKRASEEARRVEDEIAVARAERQRVMVALRNRVGIVQEELTGVAAKAAFFARRGEVGRPQKSTEQLVREEAAERKVLREAKEKLCAAIRDVEAATNYRRRSAFRKEIRADLLRNALKEEAAKVKLEEDEKVARAARKVALNEKWICGH